MPSHLAGPPPPGTPVPAAVARLAGGSTINPIWLNGLGGLTYRLGLPDGEAYVKWTPPDSVDLRQEAERLAWAGRFTSVPEVLTHGVDDDGSWLLTRGLPASSAVDPRWLADPETAAHAVGKGLRALHEALPLADCPWSWSVQERLHRAGRTHAADLGEIPELDLVVCHGDACVPNTLLHDDGTWAAHVDLGSLGVADRWADLAIAAWSTEWNYGPGWEGVVYDAYGIEPAPEKIAFYRRLWDLT